MLDLAPWLVPLDGANPSGEDLRAHPRFHDLERLLTPQSGDPVDWAAVLDLAEELRTEGRDLRLLVIVTRALAGLHGPAGLADGLKLVAETVVAHWDTLHPELRPAPRPQEAAQRRISAIRQLEVDAGRWDPKRKEMLAGRPDGALGDLRCRTFFAVRALGQVSGRDLERGTLDARAVLAESASGLNASDQAAIVAEQEALVQRVRTACAALADQAPAEMAALTEGASAALAALGEVEAALAERLGSPAPLPELRRALERMLATLARPTAAAAAPVPEAPEPMSIAWPATEQAAAPATGGLPDRLSSRAEVIACLDRIIEFYDRTEPASPVPFLARRMRRMVPMDFLELMEDLAPSGLKEFRSLAGIGDDKRATARTQGEKT